MDSLLIQLEQSGFATWIRESGSLLSYPFILFLHTLGLGLLVGLNAAIDLRILGFAPGVPLKSLERTFPFMWAGFTINAMTGTVLFMSDATKHFSNPAFFVKLAFIALAVVNLRWIRSKVFHDSGLDKRPVQMSGKILSLTSLTFWLLAITAGRLMAYISEFISYQ
jgi:hypothetical protein